MYIICPDREFLLTKPDFLWAEHVIEINACQLSAVASILISLTPLYSPAAWPSGLSVGMICSWLQIINMHPVWEVMAKLRDEIYVFLRVILNRRREHSILTVWRDNE